MFWGCGDICSICTKFEADLWVFPAKFAKTRKLNQTFGYNDIRIFLLIFPQSDFLQMGKYYSAYARLHRLVWPVHGTMPKNAGTTMCLPLSLAFRA